MKVKEVMTTKIAFVHPTDKVMDAARLMQKYNVGSIPVCDEDSTLRGIVTDRDIVIRNIAYGNDPFNTDISGIMTPNVKTVDPDTNINDVTKMMAEYQIRRIPVVEDSKLVGIVALGDMATDKRFDTEASEALTEISKPRKRY